MKKLLIVIVLASMMLMSMPGCTEEQRRQADQAANVVENVTQGGQAVIDSPAGKFVPSNIRTILETVGFIAMSLVTAWREWRRKQTQTALEQVIDGNEIAKKKSEDVNSAIKEAQTITQSSKTTELVAKVRAA